MMMMIDEVGDDQDDDQDDRLEMSVSLSLSPFRCSNNNRENKLLDFVRTSYITRNAQYKSGY